MEILAKMTVLTVVGGQVKKLLPFENGKIELFRVAGRVDKMVAKESKLSAGKIDTCFVGEFLAQRNGQEFFSTKLYLPEIAESLVKTAGEGAEFAFIVYAVENEKSAVGYVYSLGTIQEPKGGADKLKLMLSKQPELPLNIAPAPAPAPALAPAPSPSKKK